MRQHCNLHPSTFATDSGWSLRYSRTLPKHMRHVHLPKSQRCLEKPCIQKASPAPRNSDQGPDGTLGAIPRFKDGLLGDDEHSAPEPVAHSPCAVATSSPSLDEKK